MPLDRSIKRVLVIGAGPIVIGQGCEFDYSGTQGCKALREEGCKVILLNSNPATVMTDRHIADAVYIEPIVSEIVEKILYRERPDSLLATMGGQTALNCTLEMAKLGILKKYGINLLGLSLDTIEKAENRELFKEGMLKIGIDVPKSFSIDQKDISFPVIVRCSYTLGGQGGGVAHCMEELEQILAEAAQFSEKVLIEESVIGWKEYELEVMRDRGGNCLVVCGIENLDPMGVHTGDSITVSPIQTLTDKEYQLMRKMAFRVMEAIGMVSGGCNVQFAVNPKTGRMLCIEVNPRVSRSSALASKATGYPIAKIAAKLALGYHLDELQHSFEPAIDYVVTKIPRFTFEKFPQANQQLTTYMKSVGEVMGIGRTFKESFNKAISSLDVEKAFLPRKNGYDPWFLNQINELEEEIVKGPLERVDFSQLHRWKQMGFSDEKLALLLNCTEREIFELRENFKLHPVYKRVDSCSAEFPTETAYMYSTYEQECESNPTSKKKILVLGSGPNRIGQGIEFDYCCVHAVKAIRELGYESILLNCNPETVSTDYDTTDRLYFEPLTLEHVREVIHIEKPVGTIIQFGGQTPLNIGKHLDREGLPLLGTPFASIDLAEDRKKFQLFAARLGIKQPRNGFFSSRGEALKLAKKIGFPMILRPSYVIGGTGIEIIQNESELNSYCATPPVLMEEFLEGALEVEVDAISDGREVFICGIVEHIEPAGIHSGDSMSFLSPYRLKSEAQSALMEQTRKIGLALGVVGLFNVQFAIHKEEILVLEVNPRASRTVPLLSKTTGLPLVQIATKAILGLSLKEQGMLSKADPKYLGLKLPVFPFERLHLKNETLGPQMKSTGEVLCIGKTFEELFMKAKVYKEHISACDLEIYNLF